MFGKRILSIVGLLFLSGQLNQVKADISEIVYDFSDSANPLCTVSDGVAGDDDKLFVIGLDSGSNFKFTTSNNDNKKIVRITNDGAACEEVNAGLYILNGNTEVAHGDIDTSTTYGVYLCNGSKCAATNGFVQKQANTYYKVVNGEMAVEDPNTAEGTGTPDCTSHVGNVIKTTDGETKYLCISSSSGIALPASDDYLLTGTAATGNPYTTNVSSDSNLAIATGSTYAVLNTLADDVHEFCVTAGKVILGTREAFCSSASCTEYYSCPAGVCTRTDDDTCTPSSVECSSTIPDPSSGQGCTVEGYYLTQGDSTYTLQTEGTSGSLFHCTNNACVLVSSEKKVGYYLHQYETGGKYIKCVKGGQCTGFDPVDTNTEGCVKTGGDIKVGDIIKHNSNYEICTSLTSPDGIVLNSSTTQKIITLPESNTLSETEGTYVFDIDTTNAFIHKNAVNDEYYLQDTDAPTDLEETNTAGTLLECAQNTGLCTSVGASTKVGYYKNSGSATQIYISCEIGTGIECKPYTPIAVEATTGCGATKQSDGITNLDTALAIGDLINDNGTIQLCIGLTQGTGVTVGGTAKEYFISVNTASIFGSKTSHYVLVEFDTLGNVLRDNENVSIPRYRYTNASNLIRASSDSDVCNEGPTSAIVEFKYNKCDSEDKTDTDSVQTNYYSIVPY